MPVRTCPLQSTDCAGNRHGYPGAVATRGVEFHDRALYVGNSLILADLHIGLGDGAVELPVAERSSLIARVQDLLSTYNPREVVVAGDILHSFSDVPGDAAETVLEFDETVRAAAAELVVTPGNHDTMLEGIWAGRMPAEYRIGDGTVVCHGHRRPETQADRYVIGHDHPTLRIEGQKRPCYLVGEQAAGTVVMLPAFGDMVAGVTVNRMRADAFQSPLVTDTDELAPVVWDDRAGDCLSFPPLGRFREML